MEKIGKTLVLLEPSAPLNEGVTPVCAYAYGAFLGVLGASFCFGV